MYIYYHKSFISQIVSHIFNWIWTWPINSWCNSWGSSIENGEAIISRTWTRNYG